MIELLSPVGDFECLKAAVQNGADTVYFGASLFSARAFASNFDDELLEKAINYAKVRGVKTNLTLNTLIKNNELAEAINLAKKAYEFGIDAIIVQDLGLAKYLIKNFPDLPIHGSTQMTVHNLEGAIELQNLGFSRVVLSRELNIKEIEEICKNTSIEVEAFVHGALCISYSGQCLFSSMVGGRSGNRGRCAQPCRLPYELLENDSFIDKGFLLSTKDLCGLEYLPQLVNCGIDCLKIEGRMKTPEYVATVTRIYRKYLDLAISGKNYIIDEQDKKDLAQVFNRGGFSNGHLNTEPNKKLIYPVKPNNMGLYLGKVTNFNKTNGYISFITNEVLNIGDKISVEDEKYTISELMINNKNIKQAVPGDKVKIGRMKGKIFIGNKIYKISDKALSQSALDSLNKESRKRNLSCILNVKKDSPISIEVTDGNLVASIISDIYPTIAINSPITKERLISQLSKTSNTPFAFKDFNISLDENLHIPSIGSLNELRRNILEKYENMLIQNFKRTSNIKYSPSFNSSSAHNKQISVLLNLIHLNYDYSKLNNIDNIYIPFKYFTNPKYSNVLNLLTTRFKTYIYMPTIIRKNYKNLINSFIDKILANYNIKGFVISNISNFELLKNYAHSHEFICNYTFNVFNNLTIDELNVSKVTLSPELNHDDIMEISNKKVCELIVYGITPVMNSNYCLLGKSNKCYPTCKKLCNSTNKYYLKDRLGFLFRIIPDNIETVTTIYNSKITSIEHKDLNVSSVRIDILDENINEINKIINIVKTGKKLEGNSYTNGNFNKIV